MLIVAFFITATPIFAQETKSLKNGLTLGAGFALGPNLQGSSLEFGFALFEKKRAYLRNHIELNGIMHSNDYISAGLRERLIFGGQLDITEDFSFRPYCIIDFKFSILAHSEMTDIAFILEPRAGIGMEFMSFEKISLFLEVLAGGQIIVNTNTNLNIGASIITSVMGVRWYIN